uniref:Uncharacterized protein n=1 Tax=Caenorhabditis tropicalis TaxID=1561998 RepID=A0A1I7SXH0_9PELO
MENAPNQSSSNMSQTSDSSEPSVIVVKEEQDPLYRRNAGFARNLRKLDVRTAQTNIQLKRITSTVVPTIPAIPSTASQSISGLQLIQANYGDDGSSEGDIHDNVEDLEEQIVNDMEDSIERNMEDYMEDSIESNMEDYVESIMENYMGVDVGNRVMDEVMDDMATSTNTRRLGNRGYDDMSREISENMCMELGITEPSELVQEESPTPTEVIVTERVAKRRKVDEEEDRHEMSETDTKNILYHIDMDDEQLGDQNRDFYFTNDRRDVKKVLSFYEVRITANNKMNMTGRPEKLTENSSLTR